MKFIVFVISVVACHSAQASGVDICATAEEIYRLSTRVVEKRLGSIVNKHKRIIDLPSQVRSRGVLVGYEFKNGQKMEILRVEGIRENLVSLALNKNNAKNFGVEADSAVAIVRVYGPPSNVADLILNYDCEMSSIAVTPNQFIFNYKFD